MPKPREINRIIVHCSATPPDMDIGAAEIGRWHRDRGWQSIGYHYVIRRDGKVEIGRSENVAGAHTHLYNHDSIGVCWVGGVDSENEPQDNRTQDQRLALADLVWALRIKYPHATVHGHREFAAKACPSFDVQKEDWAK